VVLAAGDTFRAAAVEQLQAWGERVGAPVITAEHGGDAAALAYRAHETAIADEADVLLIDTAGRLQNKDALMQELHKIVRVLKKRDGDLPHETLLVLDGTVGSNALSQVEAFAKAVPLTGLAITKLDGTARGGALVAAARKSALPVRFVGVGESAEDLVPFDAAAFARGLVASTAEAEA
jgi:fused signal recognition particle receptor